MADRQQRDIEQLLTVQSLSSCMFRTPEEPWLLPVESLTPSCPKTSLDDRWHLWPICYSALLSDATGPTGTHLSGASHLRARLAVGPQLGQMLRCLLHPTCWMSHDPSLCPVTVAV